jgi:hypothetical protein
MKPQYVFIYFSPLFSLLFTDNLFGQANVDVEQPMPSVFIRYEPFGSVQRYTNATQIISSYFVGEGRTNIAIIVDTPQPCPLEYTNIISNTNLFSSAEQMLLIELPTEYKNVTTNAPPKGSLFAGMDKTANSFFMEGFTIARFQYTNSEARVKVFFNEMSKGRAIGASFRNQSGNGYEVLFNNDVIAGFRQFKHGQLDGLWADFESGHCSAWMHFANGKAVGKWLMWNKTGSLYIKAKFKQPYDFIGHLNFSP